MEIVWVSYFGDGECGRSWVSDFGDVRRQRNRGVGRFWEKIIRAVTAVRRKVTLHDGCKVTLHPSSAAKSLQCKVILQSDCWNQTL